MSGLSVETAEVRFGGATAIIAAGDRWSWGRVAAAVRARRESLQPLLSRGPERAPIAVVGRHDVEAVLDVLTALTIGRCAMLLHPRHPAATHTRWCKDAGAAAALDGGAVHATGVEARPAGIDGAVVVPTSGSTGRPTGVVLTRGNLVASATASAANLGWRDDDAWWLDLPIAHVGGLSVVTRCLLAGRTIVCGDGGGFSPIAFAEAVAAAGVTLASLVPTMLHRLVADGVPAPSTLRAVLVGGAACAPSLAAEARGLGWPVVLTWGQTEAASQIATQPPSEARSATRTDDVGEVLPGLTLRVRDGRGEVMGPQLFAGRLVAGRWVARDPGAWHDTGDLVRCDASGRVRVLGRADARINSGGENVDPAQVEAALIALAPVASAAVVGVPDAEWGERVAAAIVWRGDAPFDERATRDALGEQLPQAALPRQWRVVSRLPLGPNGKLDRRRIAEMFSELDAGEA